MPGPVSQSHDPDPFDGEQWRHKLAATGNRYFVLKIADAFRYLDHHELESLDELLAIIEEGREADDKPSALSYWVYARHWPGAAAVKKRMELGLGHAIGLPYEVPEE